MNKKATRNMAGLLVLLVGTSWILARHNKEVPYQKNEGLIFGTVYNITYQSGHDLQNEIEAELKRFDGSLSPFNDTATITRFNRNEPIHGDTLFRNVVRRSLEISEETEGAFDITIAPLANAWGFGFKQGRFPDSLLVDSLLEITDYRKIRLTEEGEPKKEDSRVLISCSAIAKGYAVDVIAELLERKGIKNFLVEIGGEIVTRGMSAKKKDWTVGIPQPIDDSLAVRQEIQTVLQVGNVGIATSGNYRNYHYRDGKKYAHTIDPRTGYPVQHSLLSATVIAGDCMSADAYATAFMVMGIEKAEEFLKRHPELEAYFIYSDEEGKFRTYFTPGMEKYLDRP